MSAWILVSMMFVGAVPDETATRPGQDAANLGTKPGTLLVPGAGARGAEAPRSAKDLRAAVHKALRAAATETGKERDAAVRRLAAVYVELSQDTQLSVDERLVLGRTVRSRLVKVKDQIKHLQPELSPLTAGKSATSGSSGVIAPVKSAAEPQGQLGGTAAPDHGEELVDLIERTIAPDTWDINGGLGSIRYFSPLNVIVVRQTGDVHDSFFDALNQLRQ